MGTLSKQRERAPTFGSWVTGTIRIIDGEGSLRQARRIHLLAETARAGLLHERFAGLHLGT